jgi:hypothetical protein
MADLSPKEREREREREESELQNLRQFVIIKINCLKHLDKIEK